MSFYMSTIVITGWVRGAPMRRRELESLMESESYAILEKTKWEIDEFSLCTGGNYEADRKEWYREVKPFGMFCA